MKKDVIQKLRNEFKLDGLGGGRVSGMLSDKHVVDSQGKGVRNIYKTSDVI